MSHDTNWFEQEKSRLGSKLRALRRLKSLRLADVEEKTGLTMPQLSRLENGLQHWAWLPTFQKLADAYGMTLCQLMCYLLAEGDADEHD